MNIVSRNISYFCTRKLMQ